MITNATRQVATLLAFALLLGTPPGVRAAEPSTESHAEAIGRTPPRLSYTNGAVSFWRPGAQDWAPAQVNTPLAAGDELYTGNHGNLELQVGTRAFVRAWGDTQMGLANHEPDLLQFKVTSGHVSLDLRSLDPGRTVELDTPHAAFTIGQPGYYRADVTQDRTAFIARRAGRATMTPAGGRAVAVEPSEEVVLEGTPTPTVQSYVAPDLDTWDQWNYARTDHLIETISARYVPPDVYGVDDLDHSGNWRVVPDYGAVWVPEAVATGWVPYSTGRWISDPSYGWTWVDTAPWGWAPFHYGRWIFVDGYWAWAPGPVVARPIYAPALVAFFGGPGIRAGIGAPAVSWVALGWGEPVVPWWGRPGVAGRARWAGWGGPRVVNNVVVNRTTAVNVNSITVYKNVNVQNAMVAVRQDHFGGRSVQEARIAQVDAHRWEPVRGPLRVTREASSFVAASGPAARPPESTLSRQVVATRPLARRPVVQHDEAQRAAPVVSAPAPRIVSTPRTVLMAPVPLRPPFGMSQVERGRPPLPPHFEALRPEGALATPREAARTPEVVPGTLRERGLEPQPRPSVGRRGTLEPVPQPSVPAVVPTPQRVESARPSIRPLPGEPANRLFPGRAEIRHPRPAAEPVAPSRPGGGSGPSRERDKR